MAEQSIERPLAHAILSSARKVAIVEGARGVGKSWMARHQIEDHGYRYVDLSDRSALRAAQKDAEGWFASLGTGVIIDEAQLLEDLPLLVKQAVDRVQASSPLYILTGSASIGLSGLGGQNPLIRRATRFRLDPLTQREIRGETRNLIDDLWDAEPLSSYQKSVSRNELYVLMAIGGFPEFVTNSRYHQERERRESIQADISNILGTALLPTEGTSALAAKPLLDELLVKPGSIVNFTKLAKDLEIKAPRVRSYFEKLVERFLVFPLPNLQLQPKKQAIARSKVHPVDTAYAVDALQHHGIDVLSHSEAFGDLFESFVVGQVLPFISWSERMPDPFFWRDTKSSQKEVDLVLKDHEEILGLEVKSATRVDERDFSGLRRLSETKGLSRGYVVYCGDTVIQQDENLWALPVSALWDSEAFDTLKLEATRFGAQSASLYNLGKELRTDDVSTPSDANLIMSFNHEDEAYLGGAFKRFIDAVCAHYEFETGSTLNVVDDAQAFLWDDVWRSSIAQSLGSATFLMPQVTPRYVKSAKCRDELFSLYEKGSSEGATRCLALIWLDIDELELEGAPAKARTLIEDRPSIDIQGLWRLAPSDPTYQAKVLEVAAALKEMLGEIRKQSSEKLTRAENSPNGRLAPDESDNVQGDEETVTRIADLEEILSPFERAVSGTKLVIATIETALNSLPQPDPTEPDTFKAWIQELAQRIQSYPALLNRSVDEIENQWQNLRKSAANTIEALQGDNRESRSRDLLANLYDLRRTISLTETSRAVVRQIVILQVLAPQLRPLSEALTRFLDVCDHITQDVDILIERTEGR